MAMAAPDSYALMGTFDILVYQSILEQSHRAQLGLNDRLEQDA